MNYNIICRIIALIVVLYASTINIGLVLSMFLSFAITSLLVMFIELDDEDMIQDAFEIKDIPEESFRKQIEVLIMGLSVFLLLTVLFNKMFI